MSDGRRYVYLWSLTNPAIIVPARTGVVYCNQTDGVATVHHELEGWLLPLPKVEANVFSPSWWERNYNRRVSGDETEWGDACRKMEAALRGMLSGGEAPTEIAVVDHPDNCEAWVHVSFLFTELGAEGDGTNRVRLEGVLTWENCD